MNKIWLAVSVLLLCFATQVSAVDTYHIPDPSNVMDTWFGTVYNKGGMPTGTNNQFT